MASIALLLPGLIAKQGSAEVHVPGSSQPTVRIVGGERAASTRSPWMVALSDRLVSGWRDSVFCGGVLIASDWVLTAEHCTWGMSRRRIVAHPGAGNLSGDLKDGIPVDGILRSKVPRLDVALLHLESRSPNRPLGIAARPPEPGTVATALGWGSVTGGGRIVSRLRQVDLEVGSLDDCRAAYFGSFTPATMLCAGGGGKDTCAGDSGGPLVLDDLLIGITSFGRGCGRFPGVYARVDGLAAWIGNTIERDSARHRRAAVRARKMASARKARAKARARAASARRR